MIQYAKLTTGDEVIADIEKAEENYVFSSPARIVFTQQGIGLLPFNPFMKEKDKIIIATQHVVYTAEIEDEIKNAYNEKFGNGLFLPSSLSF